MGYQNSIAVAITNVDAPLRQGAAVVAKLGVAAMKITKVACVVGKVDKAVSAFPKTGKVMRTLRMVDQEDKFF